MYVLEAREFNDYGIATLWLVPKFAERFSIGGREHPNV